MVFRNPQALSSALTALGTLQPRAFGFLNIVDPLVSVSNYLLFKASHLCCTHMTCNTHTPDHPNAADEAWYWPKHHLCCMCMMCNTHTPSHPSTTGKAYSMGQNASCALGDGLTSRHEGHSQPRELFSMSCTIHSCAPLLMQLLDSAAPLETFGWLMAILLMRGELSTALITVSVQYVMTVHGTMLTHGWCAIKWDLEILKVRR